MGLHPGPCYARPVRALGLLVLLLGQPAAADTSPEQALIEAQGCLSALDFACAEAAYLTLVPRLGDLAPATAHDARVLGAEVALSTECWSEAERRLVAVLQAEPRFRPAAGAWPPAWLDVLAGARRRGPDRAPPTLRWAPPAHADAAQPLVVTAQAHDPSGIARATLHLSDTTLTMTSTDGVRFTAVVPAARVQAPAVSLWLEVSDNFDNVARGHGPDAPHVVEVEDDGALGTWWPWALAGGAVIAAGVVAGLALRGDDGSITVDTVWPRR